MRMPLLKFLIISSISSIFLLQNITSASEIVFNASKATDSCKDKWTSRGVLDENMFSYCMNQQTDGYKEAIYLTESKYQNIAGEINQKNPQAINTQGETYICNIPVGQIKYIEALQNYIKIGFVNGAGKLNEQIERATMKQVDDESGSASIVRCHRSYMVNQDAIISVKGNAQGLLLSLSDCEKVIPVSRSYVPKFR